MGKTNIEWCDYTINPFVGCSHCSPGCDNCYAEKFAARLAKNPVTAEKYAGVIDSNGKWTGKISQLDMSCFDKLPHKPSRVFVGSMTDFFHENVPYEYQKQVIDKMYDYPHTFLLLTKRLDRVRRTCINWEEFYYFSINVWLGVTICNQEEANRKIPHLLSIPCIKRFISVEPCLGYIDISAYLKCARKINWVICGGETGPGARPMNLQWARNLRDQCRDAGTPFFFKKAGNKVPIPDDLMVRDFPEM